MNVNEAIQSAMEHHQARDLQGAEIIYKDILKVQPDNYMVYNNLANVLREKGQLAEAIFCYQKVIEIKPDDAMGYNNLANALQEKGQVDEAVKYYQKALDLKPDFDMARNNLAVAYCGIGNIHRGTGRLQEAMNSYEKALSANPNSAGAYFCLADIFLQQNLLDEAATCFNKALQLSPPNAEVYKNIGYLFHQKGKFKEAATFYQKAIEIDPDSYDAYNNLGSIFRYTGQLEEALAYYQKAIEINPEFTEVYLNVGNVCQDKGQIAEAEKYYRKAIQIKPDFVLCYSNLLFALNYDSRHDVKTVFKEHISFAEKYAEPLYPKTYLHTNDRSPNRRIKIAYLSPDFRRHPVAYFVEPALSSHNHIDFEVFCYMNGAVQDEITERMRKYADQWRNISGFSSEKVDELIRNDGIDILIDLAGHTANNRILLFARKPAPIQVSWTGYLTTTGLSAMDYKICDMYTDPPGMTEKFYTEKLVRLPESFLCYSPDGDAPENTGLPALKTGYITFGSLNKLAKVSQEVISAWSEILKAIPNSKMIMKDFCFADGMTCRQTIDKFIQRGVAAEQITFQSWDPSPKHLETYNMIDIGLDTFPFNGATTTCEALWMGVPVITLAGNAYHSRTGISLLSNVGLKELVAKTYDEYIEIAVRLATDINKLRALRERLRDMMKQSPLMNAKQFTLNLEDCYRRMWKTWCTSV
jgi:protein O-GlcNAc transferase